jgi:Tfp pilus assembly protein PilZ
MKRLLLGDHRENLLTTLDTILKHWGYRVLAMHRPERLARLTRDTDPDLVIVNAEWLSEDADGEIIQSVSRCIEGGASLIVLGTPETRFDLDLQHQFLRVPVDVFALFSAVQSHLEKYPRQNMRLALTLPAMICRHHKCHLGEILSLSARGLFMKVGFRLEQGEKFRIVLPLLGMKQELELTGKVLYCIHPDPGNNYQQGIGVEFVDLPPQSSQLLERYIENCFMEELSVQKARHGWQPNTVGVAAQEAVLHLPALT